MTNGLGTLPLQASLAVVGLLASAAAWLLGASVWWLVAGLMIWAVVPFTLIIIMPTNHKLLTPDRDPACAETRASPDHRGRLHAVRSVLGLLATALMLWQLSRSA